VAPFFPDTVYVSNNNVSKTGPLWMYVLALMNLQQKRLSQRCCWSGSTDERRTLVTYRRLLNKLTNDLYGEGVYTIL